MKSEPNARRVKLVIDTNTLVSGTLWSGPSSQLIDALEQGRASLVLSADLLAEFADVVNRERLSKRLATCNVTPARLVAQLARIAEFVSPAPMSCPSTLRDPKDLIVLAAAVSGRVDAIVTGDEDLITMKSFEGIPIFNARMALERLGLGSA